MFPELQLHFWVPIVQTIFVWLFIWGIHGKMCLSLKHVSLRLLWWSRIHLSMQGPRVQSLVRELCMCAQSCLTLCNSMDCSPPGFSVHRIFQARILEWFAISFFRESSWIRDRTLVFCTVGRFITEKYDSEWQITGKGS